MNAKRTLHALITVCLWGLVASSGLLPTVAADGDNDGFRFKLDPVVLQPLFVDVNTSSSKFEEYRDMDNGMTVPRLHLFGESADGNRTFEFLGLNISRDDERYTLRYGLSGAYSFVVDYNVIPHRFGNDGTFLYSDTDPDMLRIPDPVRQSFQDQIEDQFEANPSGIGLDFLGGLLQPFIETAEELDLSLERQRAHARLDFHKLRKFSWGFNMTHERRTGNRPYGGSFGFSNIVEIPEPIRYETLAADLGGEWNGARGGVRFGLRFSRFVNDFESVTYDNPFRVEDSTDSRAYLSPGGFTSIGGPASGRNALAPDNTAGEFLDVDGRAKLGSRGWFHGSASYGMMEQDDRLLAYTTNTVIDTLSAPAAPFEASDPSNLPTENADTEVKMLHLSASAGVRLWSHGSLRFRYRYYDYDNESSQVRFPGYVRFDAVWEEIPRITVPYSYTRQSAGVEFNWDVTRSVGLGFSYDRKSYEREFREVDDSDEDILGVSVDARVGRRLSLRGSYEHGDRSVDDYEVEAQEVTFLMPTGVNNQPTLRKFDEAERTYDEGRISAMIMATDEIGINLSAGLREEDYDKSEFGLVSDDSLTFGAEFSYTPGAKMSFFIFGHRSDRESFQRARQSGGTLSTNPADDWELTLDEVTDSWGLGLEGRFNDRWSGRLNAQWSQSDGDSEFFSPPGGNPDSAEGFPEYDDNEWLVVTGRLEFLINPHARAGLTVAREEYSTNRFARDGLAPYLPGSLILNADDGDYDANIVAVDLSIAF